MSHEIEIIDGKGSFASVIEDAWHRLGVVTTEQVTAEKLLQLGNADYEVFLTPSFAKLTRPMLDKNGHPIMIPGTDQPMTETIEAEDPKTSHICRFHPTTGHLQVLGTSSPKYQVVSNRELFIEFGDAILDVAEPTASTCGVLYDGRQAFMSWKLPKGVTIGDGDGADLWMVARTSHDLSAAMLLAIVPIRPVCKNTLTAGLAVAEHTWKVKHYSGAKLNLQAARDSLGIAYEYADEWASMMEGLAMTPMTTDAFTAAITDLWGPGDDATKKAETVWEPKKEALVELFTTAPTAGGKNLWGAWNAVTEWCDWSAKAPAADSFQTDSGLGGADGYRFWRSLSAEKSVTQPKQDFLKVLAVKAGFKPDALTARVTSRPGALVTA